MMAFMCELGKGQQVYFENEGLQTIITMISSRPGQQQSQRTSFQTGNWSAAPHAYQTKAGVILQIETAQKCNYISIEGNSISIINQAVSLEHAKEIELQATENLSTGSSMPPMEPMKAMEPIKMGKMEMQMNPMQMRMGSMQMSLEQPDNSQNADQSFCSQCGHSVEAKDSFCSNCGHQLRAK